MDNTTSRRVKQERELRGWTQQQLAEKMQLPDASYISKMENGIRKVSPEEIAKLSKIFECSMYYLLGLTNDRNAENPTHLHLPILGTIRAGVPILAQESYDGYLDVPDSLRADFALRVIGDSMIGAGILEGDLAICRESKTANTGQIVVGIKRIDVDYSEATLKYYYDNVNGPVLRPANPNYPEFKGYEVNGIMVALIREDAPGYQTYMDYITVAGREEWSEVIDAAAAAGIKPEHLMAYIDMVKSMGK